MQGLVKDMELPLLPTGSALEMSLLLLTVFMELQVIVITRRMLELAVKGKKWKVTLYLNILHTIRKACVLYTLFKLYKFNQTISLINYD